MHPEKRQVEEEEEAVKRFKAAEEDAAAAAAAADSGIAIDNELLRQQHKQQTQNAAAVQAAVQSSNTFHQMLLNNELPQTQQILQERLNSPSAQEFKAQLAKTAAAATGATPESNGSPYEPDTTGGGVLPHDDHPPNSQTPRPQVGSAEWHKQRRDNHKEVERRRRENINRGIERIAQIVPDCDKQKSQILKRAYEYIEKLKAAESANMEKYALEKLLREQAIEELSQRNKKLTEEVQQAWRETEQWKKAAMERGVTSIDDTK
uniref:ARAD1D03784p n=1 Tax=Blastobotrys adeninivorans TaxID=409370 RepID=A0A060T8I3_BLAAD